MGCPCKRVNDTIVCTNCGATQNVRHREDTDPMQIVKVNGIVCKNCKSTDFTVKEKGNNG